MYINLIPFRNEYIISIFVDVKYPNERKLYAYLTPISHWPREKELQQLLDDIEFSFPKFMHNLPNLPKKDRN